MHQMMRGEQAEAMKGLQRSITGARALSLTMTTKGHTGTLFRRVKIVNSVFIFLSVGLARGELLSLSQDPGEED